MPAIARRKWFAFVLFVRKNIKLVSLQRSVCEAQLRDKLVPILLRRTKEAVLASSLPPRREFVVRCALTDLQRAKYMRLAVQLLKGEGAVIAMEEDSSGALAASCSSVVLGEVEGRRKAPATGVLPHLMAMRLCCDCSLEADTDHRAAADLSSVQPVLTPDELQQLFLNSTKLKVSSSKCVTRELLIVVFLRCWTIW